MKKAITRCLKYSCRLDSVTVLMPEMSLPEHPFPEMLCIETMFEAIEQFSSTIKDINEVTLKKIVIMTEDSEKIELFERVFLQRYNKFDVNIEEDGIIRVIDHDVEIQERKRKGKKKKKL